MSKNTPKDLASELLRKYDLRTADLDDIVRMISDYGFDVIDYDLSDAHASSTVLIDRLEYTEW